MSIFKEFAANETSTLYLRKVQEKKRKKSQEKSIMVSNVEDQVGERGGAGHPPLHIRINILILTYHK